MQRSGITSSSPTSVNIFSGVRFVLFGFDSVSEAQYRSELVRRGGVNVGRYDERCTHVIVSGRVYDDPLCVAAREDGKTLVTELWVDDCLELEMLVDATRILYKPVKDLNGIPGSESLHICLTGYQRQERDCVMKMVSLMGAKFTKPLIANKVTHLICYKFEGEKYELAKKVNIKLVNHRWLEDCLKAWQILPIDGYAKSGWELEVLEKEAMDSEDEAGHIGIKLTRRSSVGTSVGGGKSTDVNFDLPVSSIGNISAQRATLGERNLDASDFGITNNALFATTSKESNPLKVLNDCEPRSRIFQQMHSGDAGQHAQMRNTIPLVDSISAGKQRMPSNCNSRKEGAIYSSGVASTSTAIEGKLSYSRKNRKKLNSPDQSSLSLSASSATNSVRGKPEHEFDGSSADTKIGRTNGKLATPTKASVYHVEHIGNALPHKMKTSFSGANSNSPKTDCQIVKSPMQQSPPSINPNQLEVTAFSPQGKDRSNPKQENSALEYAAFSDIATKCGNALPQKRKASFSRAESDSAKSNSQIVKSPIQQSPPNVKPNYQLEATAFSPRGKNHFIREQDNSALEHAAFPDSATKQQGRLINSKSLSYKRSLRRGKAVQNSAHPNKIVSLSEKPGKPTLKLDSDAQKDDLKPAPAKLATMALPDLLLHDEQDVCMPKITRNTRNHFCSSIIDVKLTEATTCKDMDSDKPLNELGEYDPATVTGNINANDNTHNIAVEEPAKTHKRQQQEEGDLLNFHDAVAKSASHATTVTPNSKEVKPLFDLRVKKSVSKRSMNRAKLSTAHNRKSKQNLHSDKNAISNQPPVQSGEMKVENLKVSMMDGDGRPFPEDIAMTNGTEVVAYPVPSSIDNNTKMDVMDASSDADKENVPKDASLYSNFQNDQSHNAALKQDDRKFQISVSKEESTKNKNIVRLESTWFILSGHRLQRKEFQGMIKLLRGRVCKDSHKWSYQATHFVVPDPVRRTEKFFAAAAAGRWILKTDYLTSSKEAGKFMDEEPYEWYRKGLTEDGAISLGAPRKWRLLREQTGHGALYGMRIIVYGDCIAPTLDTLKRVVKAGDGTILATSPPYSRFIKSGVDYAVVSPSTPMVDCWIQEFLRHQIPCVSADYLVEFVCKPGYSLERHVLYNTHSLADKSFARLSTLSEEIIKDTSTNSEEINDGLSCAVCGSCNRGEMMLVCGSEAGTVGCGIGTHIDCCDPPLEAVPEKDWFCPKCINLSNKNKKKSLIKRN